MQGVVASRSDMVVLAALIWGWRRSVGLAGFQREVREWVKAGGP
jgi:hypothetical protein